MCERRMLAAIAGTAAAHFASAGLDAPAPVAILRLAGDAQRDRADQEIAANPIGKAPWISPPTKPRRSFGTISSASLPKGWVVARFLNC